MRALDPGERWALCDYDDTLVDYMGGLKESVRKFMKLKSVDHPNSWSMEGWMGMTRPQVIEHINRFNETEVGFEKLRPLAGAVKAMRLLRIYQFRTAVITSSSAAPSSVERRARNVSQGFGEDIERLHIVPLGQSKGDILRSYTNAIWVEDNVPNAHLGAEIGHRTFIMPAHHNTEVHGREPEVENVAHVASWAEALPRIISLVPDVRSVIGVPDRSLKALERASEEAGHGVWTPRNPDSDVMQRLVKFGVVKLTQHTNRKPTAELTDVGHAVLGTTPPSLDQGPEIDI